jgi:hypothetical protein
LVGWIRIQEGKNYKKKRPEISCFEVPVVVFSGLTDSPAAKTSFEGLGKAN